MMKKLGEREYFVRSYRSDLLSTCLRIGGVYEYIDAFDKHGIDTFSLKLLVAKDLEALGIKDEEKQTFFLDQIARLGISHEDIKTSDVTVEYVQMVLCSMGSHLEQHWANLLLAVCRKDIVVNDIKLSSSLRCLENSISSLQKQCCQLKKSLDKPKKSRTRFILCGVVAGGLISSVLWLKLVKGK